MNGKPKERAISTILILVMIGTSVSCTTTRVVSTEELRDRGGSAPRLEITYRTGSVILDRVHREWPLAEGEIEILRGEVPRLPRRAIEGPRLRGRRAGMSKQELPTASRSTTGTSTS